ncbi:MAG: glutathione S-transferase [Paracoccus denitrificans]|nr:MAG: glutathione S-transferase [Paracoccus denitrificans]PZO85998.1 MAG: glutathione S-transferase [Paracoccus denitrificans]
MTKLSDFQITHRWPAADPDVVQLYSLNTPNGIKVAVMLEEAAIPYEPHLVDIGKDDQMTPEFLSLNPNNKIPAIIDPNGPGGQPMGLWESGAILIYLGDKTGKFLPRDGAARYHVLQWLMFQMGGVGPMFGQLGFFHKFAGKDIEDKRPRDRYANESRRLLGVLEGQLANGREWIAGDYSIADMALCPWINSSINFYGAGDLVGWDDAPHVQAWIERFTARPAVQRGMAVCARG